MPQVLIKADDLRPDTLSPRWKAFLELCVERGWHVDVGIMGGWTQKGGDDDGAHPEEAREMLSWFLAQPTLHLWNHGFTHLGDRKAGTSEFRGASAEAQAEVIRKTQDRIEQLCGVRLDAWGAPFNWTDHNTVVALQQFPEITYSYFTPFVPGKTSFHHELFVTCEPFVDVAKPGGARYFDLGAALRKSTTYRDLQRSFILQIHPNRWREESLPEFATFIETLEREGYTTATRESFARTGLFAGADTTARPLPHKRSTPEQRAADVEAARNAVDARDRARQAAERRARLIQKVPPSLKRAVPESVKKRLRGQR